MRIFSLLILVIFFGACSHDTYGENAEIRQMRKQFYGVWQDGGSTTISKLILKRNNTFRLETSGCFGQAFWSGKWTVLPDEVVLESDEFVEKRAKMFVLKDGLLFEDSVSSRAGYRKIK
jgi:hypothetical protein